MRKHSRNDWAHAWHKMTKNLAVKIILTSERQMEILKPHSLWTGCMGRKKLLTLLDPTISALHEFIYSLCLKDRYRFWERDRERRRTCQSGPFTGGVGLEPLRLTRTRKIFQHFLDLILVVFFLFFLIVLDTWW